MRGCVSLFIGGEERNNFWNILDPLFSALHLDGWTAAHVGCQPTLVLGWAVPCGTAPNSLPWWTPLGLVDACSWCCSRVWLLLGLAQVGCSLPLLATGPRGPLMSPVLRHMGAVWLAAPVLARSSASAGSLWPLPRPVVGLAWLPLPLVWSSVSSGWLVR